MINMTYNIVELQQQRTVDHVIRKPLLKEATNIYMYIACGNIHYWPGLADCDLSWVVFFNCSCYSCA